MIVNVDQENDKPLTYRNNYPLASHIYHRLTNSDLTDGSMLHDRDEWSPYTVSKMLPTDSDRSFENDGIHSSIWTFIVRSVNNEIIQALRGSFALDPYIKVGDVVGKVNSIEKGNTPDFSQTVKFDTLSPVMIKEPELAENDKQIIGPEHGEFEKVVGEKLKRSYELATGKDGRKGVDIWIDGYSKTQVRVSHDDDNLLPAWELEGHMRGESEILLNAYHGGIGAKTALGLGCWEVKE